MSATAVTDVLDRSMRNDAFLDAFRDDPAGAMADFDLDESERAALVSGDDARVYDVLDGLAFGSEDWSVSVVVVVL